MSTIFANIHNPHADGRNGPRTAGVCFVLYQRCANDGGSVDGPTNIRIETMGPRPGLSIEWARRLCAAEYQSEQVAETAVRSAMSEHGWSESNVKPKGPCATGDEP